MGDPTTTSPQPPAEDPGSLAITPAWQDKALWVAALGFLLPVINQKFGLGLNAGELVAALAPLATYIVSHKWKSGAITVAEIKAKNTVTIPSDLSPAQARDMLSQLGQVAAGGAKALLVILALALCFGSSRAYAQNVPDAPYAIQDKEPAPAAGVFLTTARAAAIFKECAEAKQNAADLEKALQEKPGTPFAAIAISAGLGLATGVLVTFLLTRR